MKASVLIEYNVKSLNKVFDYNIPQYLTRKLKVGHKVLVPFGNSFVEGFVLDIHNNIDKNLEYKDIKNIVEEEFVLNKELLDLGKFISNHTLSNLIGCYQIMLPKALKASNKTTINKKYISYIKLNNNYKDYLKKYPKRKKDIETINKLMTLDKDLKSNYKNLKNLIEEKIITIINEEVNREVFSIKDETNIKLTAEQKSAIKNILNDSENNKFLIHGVTGSGKTEIYIELIKNCIKNGKSAIMLVPEISLTPQIVARFKNVFLEKVAVLHSRLSEGEKYDEYRRIMKGNVDVVVGARSAIFAPLPNIGIIIIDECQSTTYKQDNNPKYNAIDVAFQRGNTHKCKVVLGSATPLLEQYARARKGLFKLINLENKISGSIPNISIINMDAEIKKRNFVLSGILSNKIKETLDEKKQIILLLNRRGYSTFISCSSCGYIHKCPNCDISLIYHKTSSNLTCHYCGYTQKMDKICPNCHEDAIKDLGLGTEKLESIIKEKFPTAKVLRMDTDTTTKKGSYEKLIDSFKNNEYDILIGTQMISKGLNFPNLKLVGIINADMSLNIPDFRSSERTFELLSQTSGRTSRYDIPGEVFIQTYNPDNYVFKYIKNNDYINFYNTEMEIRKKLKYPPYYYLVSLKIISQKYELARDESTKIKNYLNKKLSNNFIILGPSTARVFKLKNKYNFQIIIKYKKEENLLNILDELNKTYINKNVYIDIDINPINLI